jgi:hypothetical protein
VNMWQKLGKKSWCLFPTNPNEGEININDIGYANYVDYERTDYVALMDALECLPTLFEESWVNWNLTISLKELNRIMGNILSYIKPNGC